MVWLMPAAELFDVDGTQLDTGADKAVGRTEELAWVGHAAPRARIRKAIGTSGGRLLDHHLLGGTAITLRTLACSSASATARAVAWPGSRPAAGR
ncbi:hypothetical protein ACFXPX_16145 [Kitasatospora sp. NPDC059146]|uniref:hypothetical protein n=1 Tax=unclassified Kitasatospora TaxID=2633591 RepID=UPI003699E616